MADLERLSLATRPGNTQEADCAASSASPEAQRRTNEAVFDPYCLFDRSVCTQDQYADLFKDGNQLRRDNQDLTLDAFLKRWMPDHSKKTTTLMATLIFVWEELKRKNNEKADCAASTASPYSLTDLPFELIQASCLRLTKITMERLFTTILETVTPDKLGAAFEALGIDWVNECDALDNLKKTENFCSDKILESLKDEQITEQQIQEIHKHQFGDTQDQGYPYEIAFIRYVKTFGMLPSELYRRSQIPEDHPTEADQRINIKWLNLRYKGVMQQIEQSPIETTINFDPTTDTIENELLLLPSNIKTLQALTSINAAHMGLIAVSPELRELGNLKLLLNGGNNIEFIPPEIGDMEQLEILITYGNRLKAFYALLKKLPAFKAFNIEDNQLSAQENQKIEAYCQANKIINFKSD